MHIDGFRSLQPSVSHHSSSHPGWEALLPSFRAASKEFMQMQPPLNRHTPPVQAATQSGGYFVYRPASCIPLCIIIQLGNLSLFVYFLTLFCCIEFHCMDVPLFNRSFPTDGHQLLLIFDAKCRAIGSNLYSHQPTHVSLSWEVALLAPSSQREH